MLTVLLRKTPEFSFTTFGRFDFMSVAELGKRGGGRKGVNVNAYLSICSKSVSRPTQSIFDRQKYRYRHGTLAFHVSKDNRNCQSLL